MKNRRITESELVGDDNMSTMILYPKIFMELQGFNANNKILYKKTRAQSYWNKLGKWFKEEYLIN